MKIAIHTSKGSYSSIWINYCQKHHIGYKEVNAYDNDIVEQVKDCDAFMWHHHQSSYKDALFAKQLLFSLEQAGKVVFPDFNTGWHFDDKLGQKYLFEALDIPVAPSFAFFSKEEALKWVETTSFPKVFKLRGGAGSANVLLAKDKSQTKSLINKAFGKGFNVFDGKRRFRDMLNLFLSGKATQKELTHSFIRIFVAPKDFRMLPIQKGYAYFQGFIPNDGYDYRVQICEDRCIAMVRYVRKGDFRASGGHNNRFDKELIPKDVIEIAFEVADKLKANSCALDFVRDKNSGKLFLMEDSYCYGVDDDEFEHGYWDRNAVWHDEPFNGVEWIIESVIKQIKSK